jgi:hypothetical protein
MLTRVDSIQLFVNLNTAIPVPAFVLIELLIVKCLLPVLLLEE